jgi:hypothetical protein
MEKAFYVQRVAAKLKATERSIDEAMTLAAELMIEMKSAQDGLDISPVVGDPAYAKLSQTISELAQARTSIVGTHRRLAHVFEICDLRTVASTTIMSPPSSSIDQEGEDVADLAVAS